MLEDIPELIRAIDSLIKVVNKQQDQIKELEEFKSVMQNEHDYLDF